MEYKLISWNVNGQNSPQKRKIIFHWLKKQKANIVCMQETHIWKKDYKFLLNKFLGEEFVLATNQKKKGIVFYVKKELQPNIIFNDGDGRYLAVEITLNYKKNFATGNLRAKWSQKRIL